MMDITERCPADPLPENWSYALIERQKRNGDTERRWEIIDLKPIKADMGSPPPHSRYLAEPLSRIRAKCALVAVSLPLYTLAYMVWHAVRAPFSSIQMFFQAFEEFLNRPGFFSLLHVVVKPPAQLLRCLWLVVRAPFYTVAMQATALYGVFRPIEGRKWTGLIEWHWKGGVSPKQDFRTAPDDNLCPFLWRACTDKNFPHPFYFAYCFQPLGTLNDPSIKSVQFPD